MSKMYEHYKVCKQTNPDKIILIKSGTFYVILDEDATLVNQLLGLKLTPLNDQIQKCGFPINSLTKYENLLKAHAISYIITNMNENAKEPTQIERKILNEIKQTLYQGLRSLLYAIKLYDKREKLTHLNEFDVQLILLKIHIRLSFKYKYITAQNYEIWSKQITDICNMLGGWINSCTKR